MKKNLKSFFNPQNIAVIGASAKPSKVGNDLVLNLKTSFRGNIYPINLNEEEIEGLKTYKNIAKIKQPVDLAIISVPAKLVLAEVKKCARKNIKNLVIISAGFGEAGVEGKKLEQELITLAIKYGLNILGPNCLGFISTKNPINASFSASFPPAGNIAFLSQSGALGTAVLDMVEAQRIGLAYFVSLGNKAGINEQDLLEYFNQDRKVKVIMMYLESVVDGRRFMELAKNITPKKPIIVLKAGKTQEGSQAVTSHTGAMAGSAVAYSTAFKQAGIIEARDLHDFFNLAEGLSQQPLPQGNNVGIVTNAGGPGILVTDLLDKHGLKIAGLTSQTSKKLKKILPPQASTHNPVDVLGDANAQRFAAALELTLKDKKIDTVIAVLTPQKMTQIKQTTDLIGQISCWKKKPVILCFMGEASIVPHYESYRRNSLPHYNSPLQAVEVLGQMWQYAKNKKIFKNQKIKTVSRFKLDKKAQRSLNQPEINEVEAREVLNDFELPLHRAEMAKTKGRLIQLAKDIGYPVALKIVSSEVIHKSDQGGVILNIDDEKKLTVAFDRLSKKFNHKKIDGFLVGEMVKGLEIIAGMKRDEQFGPMIMVGLGGIYAEIFNDVVFRIAPIDVVEAKKMITELKSFPLLSGARGQKILDIEALAEVLVKLSELSLATDKITEIDLNPIMVKSRGQGCVIVDARIIK